MSDRRRRGWPVVVGLAAAGLAGLVVSAALDRRDLAFTTGVPITRVAEVIAPAETACQTDIRVPAPFRAVELVPRWLKSSAPPLVVELRDSRSGARLARRSVPAGYPDNTRLAVEVGLVPAGRRIDVCVVNAGSVKVGVEGGKAEAGRGSRLVIQERENERSDLSLRFLGQPRSVLSQMPLIFQRATLFRPGWVGAWTFWALAALLALAVPTLLASALAGVEREPEA